MKDVSPTKLVARDDKPDAENKPEAEDKISGERGLGVDGDGVGNALAPLSPSVGGGSWAEQVEANTQ